MPKKYSIIISLTLAILLQVSALGKLAAQATVFTIGSAANVAATTVTIPVTAANFTQFMAWQGSINWDNSKLNFASVSSPISQLTGMQFNNSVASNTGQLSFIWVDNNLTAQTIASNAVLFSITFNVIAGASGNTDLVFANTPTQLVVSNTNGTSVNNVVYNKGTIGFLASPTSPSFTIGSVSNAIAGNTINIPITAKNFYQYLAFQGTISWDTTKLKYNSASVIATQLSGIDFNYSRSSATTVGALSFTWLDANLLPQTLVDNAVLFTINFTVQAGATGTTSLFFSNEPTPMLLSTANGTSANNAVLNNGLVAFQGASLPPAFTIGSMAYVSTNRISIPVRATNFSQLLAMQGSIVWNNTKLNFLNISGIHPQIANALFNNSNAATEGRLTFLWTDSTVTAQTIDSNATLFLINFSVPTNTSGFTNLSFVSNPTNLVLSNSAGATVSNATYNNGIVTFSAPICIGGSNSVTADIVGAGYQWQLNDSNGEFINLSTTANFTNTNSATLNLTNIPSSFSGYQLRCMVNGVASTIYTIKFYNYWIGGTSTAWENAINWSCGFVPDANTDVVLQSGATFNPIVASNISLKSLTVGQGISVRVLSGFTITITGE